jgi:hypothetical protein
MISTLDEMEAFIKGTIIWRPVQHLQAKCDLRDYPFELSARGSQMARVVMNGDFMPEPEFTSQRRGVVAFIDCKEIPSNWTHAIVTGRAKQTVFARFMTGSMHEYLQWRLKVRDELIEFSKIITPPPGVSGVRATVSREGEGYCIVHARTDS